MRGPLRFFSLVATPALVRNRTPIRPILRLQAKTGRGGFVTRAFVHPSADKCRFISCNRGRAAAVRPVSPQLHGASWPLKPRGASVWRKA